MTTNTLHSGITRRQFMVGAAGLTFTVLLDGCATTRTEERSAGASLAPAPAGGAKTVNAWVSLSYDGTVYIANPAVEMGQGSQTAIPLIIADEMDADWSRVVIVPAYPDDKVYGNPGFRGLMYTAGSATVTGYWDVARTFGAQVRRVLMQSAARLWDVPLSELATEPNAVVHAKSGRRVGYGDIAAITEVPAEAPAIKPEELKRPEQYRLIGKDVMRVELPSKVNGTAQYSIDVQLPGMLYGAVLRGPVEGTSPVTIDDAQARAVPGVMRVVRLPFGVGVLAETPWAAFDAKNALKVTWDRRARAFGHDSDKAVAIYSAAARNLSRNGKPWDSAGGGFGRRGHRDEEFVVDSVLLSKEAKRPVKVLWTREDDVHNGRFRPLSVHFLRAGLDASNRIVAWQHRVACDEITAFQDPVRYKGGGEKDFLAMAGSELRTYDIPNRLSEQLPQETGIRTSSRRGIGFGPNKFATEAFLDEIAAKHGLDPVELRLQLLKNTPRGQAVIRAVVEMSDYRRARPGRGLGFSFVDYSGTMVAAVAEVSVDKTRGKVTVHDFWLALDPGI